MNFTPDWESEIVDQAGLQTNLWENRYYCAKMRILQKKNPALLKDCFSSESKSSKKKESFQDGDSDAKFIYQMLPWISFKFS